MVKLLEAIDAANKAWEFDGLPFATLVCQLVIEYDEEGNQCSGVQFHIPEGQSWGLTLGTLRAAQLRLEADFLER